MNNVTISMYKFKAAKMYSSGEIEYFLLPPIINCVSNTRYCKERNLVNIIDHGVEAACPTNDAPSYKPHQNIFAKQPY